MAIPFAIDPIVVALSHASPSIRRAELTATIIMSVVAMVSTLMIIRAKRRRIVAARGRRDIDRETLQTLRASREATLSSLVEMHSSLKELMEQHVMEEARPQDHRGLRIVRDDSETDD